MNNTIYITHLRPEVQNQCRTLKNHHKSQIPFTNVINQTIMHQTSNFVQTNQIKFPIKAQQVSSKPSFGKSTITMIQNSSITTATEVIFITASYKKIIPVHSHENFYHTPLQLITVIEKTTAFNYHPATEIIPIFF